jgi:hypothetical protein
MKQQAAIVMTSLITVKTTYWFTKPNNYNYVNGVINDVVYRKKLWLNDEIIVYTKTYNDNDNILIEMKLTTNSVTSFLDKQYVNSMYGKHHLNEALVTKIYNTKTGEELQETQNNKNNYKISEIAKNNNQYVFFDKQLASNFDYENKYSFKIYNNRVIIYDLNNGTPISNFNIKDTKNITKITPYFMKYIKNSEEIYHIIYNFNYVNNIKPLLLKYVDEDVQTEDICALAIKMNLQNYKFVVNKTEYLQILYEVLLKKYIGERYSLQPCGTLNI